MTTHRISLLKRTAAGMLCVALCAAAIPGVAAERLLDRYAVLFEGETATYNTLPSYSRVLSGWQEENYTDAAADVAVELTAAVSTGEQPAWVTEGGKSGLLLTEDTADVQFPVSVPASGLYEIEIRYYPYGGSGQAIRRAVSVDGNFTFSEAENLCLYRHFVYTGEARYNGFGDQLAYAQEEVRDWYTACWQDVDGKYAAPLCWALDAGDHTLTFSYVDQPVLIGAITLKAPVTLPDYATVRAGYPDATEPAAPITVQAEDVDYMLWRTESTVASYAAGDPAMEPSFIGTRRLNAAGGTGWGRGNQEITYRIPITESGLYKLSLRVQQPWNNGMNSYRQILIDGNIPFAEMAAYPFPYDREWYTATLSDSAEEPYLFYLTAGEHTLTVRAVMSESMTRAIDNVRDISDTISEVYRKILLITGAEPDSNYDYDLEKSIPDLQDTFAALQTELNDTAALVQEGGKKRSTAVNNLSMLARQIREMQADPDVIPKRLDDITNSMTSLGDMISSLESTPLGMDELTLSPASAAVAARRSTLWQKLDSAFRNFAISFTRDYTSVSVSDAVADRSIDVWVSRGAEWASIMQQLIQGDFEHARGIGVNLNVLPSGTLASTVNPLLLAITSGNGPDVVLNVEANTSVEYGVRGMAMDLRRFSDYDALCTRFHPAIGQAFTFQGKTYALPESMNFYLMAYRKDILQDLSLKVPKTWQEVYYQTLPVLYQNGMTMQAATLDTFLYQNGGSYYTEDGLRSALDSAASYAAFADNIAQYLDLGFPITANFFSRFRTGEMPIGFVDFNTYLQMLTAAPELAGKWSVARLPGKAAADGTVNHAAVGLTGTADMILSYTDDPDACWAFLDWWTGEETQTAYGLELESMLGPSARLNTANREAFSRLPWNRETLAVIRQFWEDAQVTPNVLGGVITTRAVNNAVNLALYSGYTPREALETAIEAINDELRRKQNLYGITAAQP